MGYDPHEIKKEDLIQIKEYILDLNDDRESLFEMNLQFNTRERSEFVIKNSHAKNYDEDDNGEEI